MFYWYLADLQTEFSWVFTFADLSFSRNSRKFHARKNNMVYSSQYQGVICCARVKNCDISSFDVIVWKLTGLCFYRFVRCSRRGNGEVVLSKVSGRLRTKVIETSPHRWRILWHRVSSHAVHGSPRIQTKTPCQPVHCTVRLLMTVVILELSAEHCDSCWLTGIF